MYDPDISTHYVNLPHYLKLTELIDIRMDAQHFEFKLIPLNEILENKCYHKYMKYYANWLVNREAQSD